MKIKEIETKQFKPFEITVETEDEAKILWCSLDVPFVRTKDTADRHNIVFQVVNPDDFACGIFNKLNTVYDPRKK
jgi:hypothetical protein